MTSISNALQPKKTPASRKIKHKMKKKIGKQNGSDLVIVERQKTTPKQTNKQKRDWRCGSFKLTVNG